MKKTALLLLTFLASIISYGQDITGQWNGVLKVQGTQLRLVFNINKTAAGFSATMDSPDQSAIGIPVTTTTFDNPKLKLEVANARIEYDGELKDNEIVGTFKQGGMEFPMNLSRKAIEKAALKRPQEPKEPFSYYTEKVTFENTKANISLAGTLSLPKKEGVFPVVVMITGSGPQNRDEELLGHKPFLVIADYLTKNGIAVLRYDDRGIGESKGDFKTATSADFASDVESAIAYLKTRKEINKKKIGLMGHSEGGTIAPMVAAKSRDINFIVMLAGTGIQGDKLLTLQDELVAKASGASEEEIKKSIEINTQVFEMVNQSMDNQKLKTELTAMLNEKLKDLKPEEIPNGMSKDDYVAMQVNQVSSPWMEYFLKYNPAPTLEKVKCAVLAVNGGKDLQVPSKENLAAIETALKKGGNTHVTIREFPNLNHLFQECKTGAPSEYAEIEQTFSPLALDQITKWIQNQTK